MLPQEYLFLRLSLSRKITEQQQQQQQLTTTTTKKGRKSDFQIFPYKMYYCYRFVFIECIFRLNR